MVKYRFIGLLALGLSINEAGAQDILRVGISREPFMPISQINVNNEWEGLEADLTREVCGKISMKCDIHQMSWDALIPSLSGNKVDVIVGSISITNDRRKILDFSLPYYQENSVLIGNKNDDIQIKTVSSADGTGEVFDQSSLDGKLIGVQTASIQSTYMAKYLPDVTSKNYDTADNSLADLVSGRIDYLLAPNTYVQVFLNSDAGKDFAIIATAPKNKHFGEGVAYAFRKDDQKTYNEINTALEILEKDGHIKEITEKWLPSNR